MARTFGGASTDRVVSGLTTHSVHRSYAAWVKGTGAGGGNAGRVLSKSTLGAEAEVLYYASGYYIFEVVMTGDNGVWYIDALEDGEWHHMVVTYDSGALSNDPLFYVDGVSQVVGEDTAPTGAVITNTDAYILGNRGASWDRNWEGDLAEFAIWDRIITPTESTSLAGGALATDMPTDLAIYYRCWTADATEPDSSGNSLTGTATGTTLATHPIPYNDEKATYLYGSPFQLDATAATVHPDSAALISQFLTDNVVNPCITLSKYACAVVNASITDTAYEVTQISTPGYLDSSIHIPAGAEVSPGDGHLSVYEPWLNRMHEFYNAIYSSGDDSWSCSCGVSSTPPALPIGAMGANAGNLPYRAGIIAPEDIVAGVIDHALLVTLPYLDPISFVWPAKHTDGGGVVGDLKMGMWLALDPDLDLDGISWTYTYEKIIAKALQDYGAFILDSSGATSFVGEDRVNQGGPGEWSAVGMTPTVYGTAYLGGTFPWDSMVVLIVQDPYRTPQLAIVGVST